MSTKIEVLLKYLSCVGYALRQKGLAVTDVFSRTLMIEAPVADLQLLVMCTANGQSCIALGGDAWIKFRLSAVVA
jgi:hypothetical protein